MRDCTELTDEISQGKGIPGPLNKGRGVNPQAWSHSLKRQRCEYLGMKTGSRRKWGGSWTSLKNDPLYDCAGEVKHIQFCWKTVLKKKINTTLPPLGEAHGFNDNFNAMWDKLLLWVLAPFLKTKSNPSVTISCDFSPCFKWIFSGPVIFLFLFASGTWLGCLWPVWDNWHQLTPALGEEFFLLSCFLNGCYAHCDVTEGGSPWL